MAVTVAIGRKKKNHTFFWFFLFIFVHLKIQQHDVSKHQIGTAVTAAHLKERLGAYSLRPQ